MIWSPKSKTLTLCKEGAPRKLPALTSSSGESKMRFIEMGNPKGTILRNLTSRWAEGGSSKTRSPNSAETSTGSLSSTNRLSLTFSPTSITNRCQTEPASTNSRQSLENWWRWDPTIKTSHNSKPISVSNPNLEVRERRTSISKT